LAGIVWRNAYERGREIADMPETDPDPEGEPEPDPESESESESAQPPADGFNIGDVVHDRDSEDDEPTSAYVATLPDATAEEWVAYEDEGEEITVAEDNPEYPADARVVVVVFGNTVDYKLPDWDRISPLSVSEIEETGGRSYSFPAPRLVRDHLSPNISAPDTSETAESDAEAASDDSEFESEEADQSDQSEAEGESTAEPSAAIVALHRYLESDGMEADIASDGQSVRATKEGESYRVNVEGVLEGDGPHRSQLEETVEKLRAAL
jgi:hypothetical protein